MRHLDELDEIGYKYYFQFTITPYDKTVEPGLRDKKDIVKTFIELSKRIGKEKVVWRYDPILMNENIDVKYHVDNFKKYVDLLSSYTNSVIISFLDNYKKIGHRKQSFRKPSLNEMIQIGEAFSKIAKENSITIKTCAEEIVFKNGIEKASCIDPVLIAKIINQPIKIEKDKNQRKECLCVESVDIGEYDSCLHLCEYCYANVSKKTIRANTTLHNKNSPLLVGQISERDVIKERKVKSLKTNQIHFDSFFNK